ncbi:hypothetical protein AB0G54_17795 [Streptomyces yokosukanensis]|uniref:hypothetical protein n=1 Tax=Streptomyces yokosukanensis TaxID=67386 RepID=UPI00343BC6A2
MLPAFAAVRHRFETHTLDGTPVRGALLDIVVQLGLLLRGREHQLMDGAGLQCARPTGISLRGEALIDAGQVARQISLDAARESRLVGEQAMDRIRRKFGPGSVGPAATAPFRRAGASVSCRAGGVRCGCGGAPGGAVAVCCEGRTILRAPVTWSDVAYIFCDL